MVYYIADYPSTKNNNCSLPIGFEIQPDGSIKLTGDATVWNDQVTNYITGEGTIKYTLHETTFEQEIPYGVYNNKIWVKLNIQAGKSVTLRFYPDETKSADNHSVFFIYDDFNDYRNNMWTYQNSNVSSSILTVKGGNQIIGATTIKIIPDNVVIEWNMYTTGNYDFDSGIKVGNLYFISDRGVSNHAISTGWTYPGGSQQSNTWNDYQVVLKSGNILFTNKTVSKSITSTLSYSPGTLSFICDSDTSANPLKVDYICVRKYYDESTVSISTTAETDGSYTVVITNNGGENLIETEIAIPDIPIDNYKVTVITSTPVLSCEAFPANTNSSIKFFTQFNHQAKYNSECAFHIHCYIPPDAPTGTVKFKLTWQVIPVEIINNSTEKITVNTLNKETKEIIKTFDITSDMRGRHVLFNFGRIDKIYSLSQIVFHRLERLGSDSDDTFSADLPYLYVDWHTEIDTLGSQSEFKK